MSDRRRCSQESAAQPSDDPSTLLAALYDTYAGPLYRYAVMLLADAAGAEDAVQQAFAKLAQMGRRALTIESAGDYLRSAVRNECWRLLARRRRRQEVGLTAAAPFLEAATADPGDADERTRVEAAVRALAPEQREVLHLKLYAGHTFQQIADLLGVSINTVASRYRYALGKLRQLLPAPGAP
jgi:RNA polymerase sigma-70 factor (ECF subfamily)